MPSQFKHNIQVLNEPTLTYKHPTLTQAPLHHTMFPSIVYIYCIYIYILYNAIVLCAVVILEKTLTKWKRVCNVLP